MASWIKPLSLLPIVFFPAALGILFIFNLGEDLIFNPPYLLLILNTIFLTGTGIAVAAVSAKSFLKEGSNVMLILGLATTIGGLAAAIAGWAAMFSINYSVVIYNIGILLSGGLQFLSGVITFTGATPIESLNRKKTLVASYLAVIISLITIASLVIFGFSPTFFTVSGPTLERQWVIGTAIAFFVISSFLFSLKYYQSKSRVLYWYLMALGLSALGLFAATIYGTSNAAFNWTARIILYVAGFYFLAGLLSAMKAVASEDFETGVSERWAEAFRSDRRQFETLFSKMLNGFAYHRIIVNDNGKPVDYVFLAVNKCFEDLTGLKRDMLIGRKVTELLPGIENDPADWIGAYGEVALTGKPVVFENFSLSLKKWYSVSAYSPRKGYFVAIFEDITERKKAQEALRESEQRWSTTLSSIGDAVISTDLFGKITFMNHEAETLTGWSLSDASQKPVNSVFKIINEQTRLEVESPIVRVLKDGIVVGLVNHTILVRKDDSEIPIDDSGAPIKDKDGKITGVVLIFRDMTERKKAEDTLRESEIKFKAVANLTHDWEYWIAPDGSILFMSPSCKRFTGYNAEEVTENPKLLSQIVHPQDREQFNSHCKLVSSDKGFEVDFRIISRDGLTHWISHVCRPVFDDQGKWIGRRVSNREITKRKKAEEEIARLALFPTQTPNPVIEVDLEGNVSYCNPAAKNAFPDLERLGSEHPFLYDLQNTSNALQKVSTCSLEREVEVEEKWFNQQFYLVPNRKLIRIYSINITERKKAEKDLTKYQENLEALVEERNSKLKDAERLAAIGATAGMVGHDIRNPLQAITSDVFLAKTELASLPSSEEKKNALESMVEIEKNIDYINKIVQDLQDYARPLNPKIEESDLRSTVETVIRKNGLPKNIKVSVEITDKATKLRVDSYYLNRILTNLVTNAVQAMPKGGKLTITAKKEADDTILSVKDTGTGIPQQIQNKMFILMFTTKSKGQGFGLPVVKRMTESLGGSVTFESQEGKGTTFIVRLPPKELNGKWTYKNSG